MLRKHLIHNHNINTCNKYICLCVEYYDMKSNYNLLSYILCYNKLVDYNTFKKYRKIPINSKRYWK